MMLSIIIPMYNVEQFIDNCLTSVLRQQDVTSNDYEIVVVNDGSPDNSLAIAMKYASEHSNIHVISQENGGLSSARNTGLANAKGDYIWFVDSDDWLEPNALSCVISEIEKGEVDFITVAARHSDIEVSYNILPETNDPHYLLITQKWAHCAPLNIYKRSFLEKNGLRFMLGVYHEDSEFTPRMMYLAKTCRVTNKILYVIYRNPNSITRSLNSKKSYDCIKVAERLADFKTSYVVEDNIKSTFDNIISLIINNSFANIIKHDKKEQTKFNKYFHERRKLLLHSLMNAQKLKYRIESWIFFLIPKRYILIYKLLLKLK